jgi:hypothetical protein
VSEQRLKDLLEDLVADVPRPDGQRIDMAWQAARRRSRRRGMAAMVSAAAVVIAGTAVVGGTLTDDREPSPGAPTAGGSPSPTATSSPSVRPPDAAYDGVPVWWAPTAADEAGLTWFDSALPSSIDLSPGRPPLEPGEPALGVFTVLDVETERPSRFLVLSSDGETRELAADHIEENRDEFGNVGALTPFNGGLSPDGWHLFFAQQRSIELYDFESGSWTTIETPEWLAEGARWLDAQTIWVPDTFGGRVGSTYGIDGRLLASGVRRVDPDITVTASDEPYGIWVDSGNAVAGSYFLSGPVEGGPYTNPEAVVARVGDSRSVLALGIDGRSKGCCPVVGWLGGGVVALESGHRVLAWDTVTGAVYRVADSTGLVPGREGVDSSWAWQALR